MDQDTATETSGITRRNLFGGIALAMLMPRPLSAAEMSQRLAVLDPVALHSLLRGLVFLDRFDDPVIEDDAAALLEQIELRLPGATRLMQLYRAYLNDGMPPYRRDEASGDLDILHRAAAEAHGVIFSYTDLKGDRTTRRVLPLALVHPPHGIQLLAWCELRHDYRKFFVAAMEKVARQPLLFADRRVDLLDGLLVSENIAL